MTNKAKPQPTIKVSITPGPVTAAWRRFWQRLITKAQSEAQNDR
ncbi:hypothetical protein ACFLWG_00600 [Chloroflexota bacterium]